VGEIMPNDDLTKMGEVLKNAHFALSDMTETPSGMIGDLEQKLFGLTLLQDAANGLAKMNDEKGVTHGHTKSQNVMIDKDGVAKVIDLGESAKTDKVSPGNYKFPDNPLYRASETTKLLADEKADRKDLRTANAETFDVMMEGLMEAVGLNPESLIEGKMEEFSAQLKEYGKEIATDLRDFAEVRQNSSKKVGNTFDSFGLGTIGFELLVGRRVTQDVEAKFSSDTMKNVESWRERGTDAIGEGGLTARSSGDPEIDRLLNGMLKSDPKERLTAAEVRDDAVMKTPGVGSPEVRELIKALASGDAGKIDAARDKVREKFGKIV
jgi:serine/threonine protein kinase